MTSRSRCNAPPPRPPCSLPRMIEHGQATHRRSNASRQTTEIVPTNAGETREDLQKGMNHKTRLLPNAAQPPAMAGTPETGGRVALHPLQTGATGRGWGSVTCGIWRGLARDD